MNSEIWKTNSWLPVERGKGERKDKDRKVRYEIYCTA